MRTQGSTLEFISNAVQHSFRMENMLNLCVHKVQRSNSWAMSSMTLSNGKYVKPVRTQSSTLEFTSNVVHDAFFVVVSDVSECINIAASSLTQACFACQGFLFLFLLNSSHLVLWIRRVARTFYTRRMGTLLISGDHLLDGTSGIPSVVHAIDGAPILSSRNVPV